MVRDERGAATGLLVSLILTALCLLGALGFGFWAFSSRQDYKNNVDTKIAAAVKVAQQQEDTKKDAEFAEEEKNPLKTYAGPAEYGSIQVQYPKTWSVYVSQSSSGDGLLDGYFQPDFVPDVNDQTNNFALRIEVTQQSYSDVLDQFTSEAEGSQVTVSPYKLPNVSNVVGSRIDGQVTPTATGSMIVLPVRDKTLKIWTESTQFNNDFNNIILAHLTFSP